MKSLSNVGAERLGDALGESIDDGAKLSIISSYFTVFAYGELKEELSKVDEVRFLFSEPTFIKRMADSKEPREFEVARRAREVGVGGSGLELTLRNNLNQRALARECAEWIREKGVFKSAKTSGAIQPGGTYVVENPSGDDHAFMGAAANFTQEGLGYERRPGTVTCVSHFENATEAVGLKMMFESVWDNPAMVEEVTAQVAAQVETLYRENPPEFIYFLTLYHLFRDFMEDDEDNGIRPGLKFEESVVWSKLYDFQKDAVVGAIRKLEKYKGCIIADSVGLGKTYEALAVMKYYQERNDRILVLCPKRLRDNWTLWTQDNDDRNPLADDRFSYTVLNHTDLSRYHGMSGEVDLEHLRWGHFDLLVIDESHNFRNKSTDADKTDRYTRLIEDVIKSGQRTKVLMLSATPVNNRLLDLRNQIELITEGDDAYLADTDGIPSITHVTRVAQQRFNEWSKLSDSERTTESFVNAVNADYFKLLDVLTIARSRKHITKYYGAASGTFPARRPPLSFQTPIDLEGELPPIAVLNDMIAQLTFAQYQVLSYVRADQRRKYEDRYGDTWGKDFESQVHRTTAVANLMRVNVLKRMESSVNSFRITLRRILDGCVDLRARLDADASGVAYGTEGKTQAGPDGRIANESYDDFANGLQKELEAEDFKFGVITPESFTKVTVKGDDGVEERLGYEKSKQVYDHLVATGMVDGKGAVTPELKAAAEEGKVELPAELEPAKEQVEAIIIHKSQRVQIRDKAKEVSVELQKDVTLDPAFQALWDRIRQRTRFQVEVDSGKLIEHAIEAVDGMLAVRPPQVTSERASLGIDDAGVSAEGTGTSVVSVSGKVKYDLPDPIAELQDAVGLTRGTIKAILEGCSRLDEFEIDPATFLAQVGDKINRVKNDLIAQGIKYVRLPEDEWYTMRDLELDDYTAYLGQNAWKPDMTSKSLYNYVVYDSAGVERSFAEALDKQEEVLVFAKLPSAFKIDTPLGSYNPDWAYVEEADGERRVYFVTETKGGKNGEPALRDAEKIKIGCAKKHFEALDLGNDFHYNVRTTYQYEAVKA